MPWVIIKLHWWSTADIYTRTSSDYVKASMDYMIGLSHIQLGQNEEGYAAYLDAVEKFPLSYDTYLGLIQLVDSGYRCQRIRSWHCRLFCWAEQPGHCGLRPLFAQSR